MNRRATWSRTRAALFGLACMAALAGCEPVADPSVGMSVPESVALIEKVAPSDLSPETVAEAFALGTRATDVQRDDITQSLVGHSVEWSFPVYEVDYAEGRYKVTSQAIPIQSTEAAPLLRVVAYVLPQSEADDALLRAVQTDDVLRVRGIVQEIRLRTVVAIVPAVVVGLVNDEPSAGTATI